MAQEILYPLGMIIQYPSRNLTARIVAYRKTKAKYYYLIEYEQGVSLDELNYQDNTLGYLREDRKYSFVKAENIRPVVLWETIKKFVKREMKEFIQLHGRTNNL